VTVHGETKILRRRAALACPDVKELRQLLERATGVAHGSQARLMALVGCSRGALRNWERGGKVATFFVPKLVEVEATLRARVEAQEREVAPPKPSLPLMANVVEVRVDGEQALLRFELKVPGEEVAREVAEVLVPRATLQKAVGSSLPSTRMPGSEPVVGRGV